MAQKSSMTHAVRTATLLFAMTGAALAQTPNQPPVPAVTEAGEAIDSGVGDLDARSWIGKTVMSSDARDIGLLRDVKMASDTSDGGLLVVEHAGRLLELPLSGASADGDRVTVTPTFERAVAN